MTTPLERLRDALTAHGCNPRGTAAKCPAHDDRRASLSIGPATQFRGALVNCHVGCHLDDILEKLGLKLADLFDEPRQAKQGYAVAAEYPYRDESGKVLYFKERRYPKDFRQYHLVNGEKVWNLNGVRRVLYRLPEILAPMARGETIYLCEGEKDAEELAKRGVATTTWTEGAWQPGAQPKWRDEYSKLLDGANVCIIQHRDENGSGQATAHDIATELKRYTKTVRIVEPAEGNDAYDYLNAGKTVDDFVPVADDTPPDAESSDVDRRYDELVLQLLDAKGLRNIPSPTPLVENWLFKDSLAWIQGKWGHGKSFLAVDIGCCVATGTDWHGKPAAQGVVLYLIAEGASGISQRVDAWEAANGLEAKGIVFLPSPVQLGKTEHIDVAAFRMLLHAIQPALVIIDTQARVTVGCDENSSKDMGIFVDVLETLRKECGSTMLVVHHEPRNAENLRGSIALEGAAASILQTLKEGDDIHIKCLKQKDIPPPDNLRLTLYPIGESAALFDNIPGERPITPNMLQVLETLGGFPDCTATPTQLKEACSGHIAKSSYYAALNRLVRMGRILESKKTKPVQYSIPEQDRAQYMD